MEEPNSMSIFKTRLICTLVLAAIPIQCAHKEKKTSSNLEIQKKRVALAEVKGPKEAKTHVEVALVNEIIGKGHCEIVDRATVQGALTIYPTPSDWVRLGKKIGADYILAIQVHQFEVKEREGLDRIEEEDSVLTAEAKSSEPVMAARYVKIKSYEGVVTLEFQFFDVDKNQSRSQMKTTTKESLNSRDAPLPSKLEFLDLLTTKTIQKFFSQVLDTLSQT